MGNVFISYRRDDAAGYARAIYDQLTERFDTAQVFMDVDAIEPGLPFDEVIRNAVGKCEVLLVLIGSRWMEVQPDGRRRLDDERDFVRLEIAAALARNIRVIPVLLDGVQMPAENLLPEPMRGLVWRNALEVSNTRFTSDVNRLADVLARVLGEGGKAVVQCFHGKVGLERAILNAASRRIQSPVSSYGNAHGKDALDDTPLPM